MGCMIKKSIIFFAHHWFEPHINLNHWLLKPTLRHRCCEVSSPVLLFATPWTAAHQASLSFTISLNLLKLMSIVLVMPFNHLILYWLHRSLRLRWILKEEYWEIFLTYTIIIQHTLPNHSWNNKTFLSNICTKLLWY